MKQVIDDCQGFLSKVNIKPLAKTISDEINHKRDIPNKNEEIRTLKHEINGLQRKIDSLYDDKFNDTISADTYIRLSQNAEERIKSLNSRIASLENEKEKTTQINSVDLENKIKKLINIKKPTRELLFYLIKRIEVDSEKNVVITYNFS